MKSRKGFTLIELMIVIAIIAIIAAIAIPNLMRSRIMANEANAVAALKSFTTAQVTFQTGKQGRLAANTTLGATAYADNYRNLFFGNPVADTVGAVANADATRNLALINQTFADAFIADNPLGGAATNNVPTVPVATAVGNPYQGYLFSEPGAGIVLADLAFTFALYALPGNSSTNGNNAFWVGQEGTVWMQGLLADQNVAASAGVVGIATPSVAAARPNWITM